ncbi:MAG: acetate--CoA ligase family protein [Herpetosiphonaceae bacterium]|nr:acetate--CoA ligase family protein [Gammaproteobacteria bacterium]MBA3945935.1 acetate--CoA ligase family protein [Herpetosiphonaceae bacterium]
MNTTRPSDAERVHDVLRSTRQPLDAIFASKTIAVIGATERAQSVGRSVLSNLRNSHFPGPIFPVHPAHATVLGLDAYPTITDVPQPVDLAVIVTPAATVPDIIGQCADAGVQAAIVISAGFKERGAAGIALEQDVLAQAHRGKLRLIGPNCLGVMRPKSGLNATFARTMALPGSVGFISQSGALCTAILDWSARENVGFSAFVSVGSMLDVGWGDLIDYLGDNLRALYETPVLPAALQGGNEHAQAVQVLSAARQAGRTLLTEVESKTLLAAYGIPTVETHSARSVAEAVAAADEIGYPVVLKLLSETITHKTDVGGVMLNLTDADAIRRAYNTITASVTVQAGTGAFLGVTVQPMIASHGYELIIGSSIDAQFGPVLLFGAGGQLVEVLEDRALALPQLNTTLARRLMEQTRIFGALKGVRGRVPVDLAALEHVLVRFSQLVIEQPTIKEIDINPLLASPAGLLALDARIVLHPASLSDAEFPRPAIRPYPTQYVMPATRKDGTPVVIRPIRAEDEPLMVTFHQTLSQNSVYLRYFHLLGLDQRVAHERLTRKTDHRRIRQFLPANDQPLPTNVQADDEPLRTHSSLSFPFSVTSQV